MTPLEPPLRTYPDRRAPNGIDPFYSALWRKAASYLAYPLLPIYVLKWLWNPRGQQLPTYLSTRIGSWTSTLAPYFPQAETWKEAASIPPPERRDMPFGNAWEGIHYDMIPVPPAPPSLCGKLAKGSPIVKRVERPMFALTPTGAQSEKILLYFHGGGYIIGHPLWNPFPLQLARDTKCRTFIPNYRKCVDDSSAFPAPLLDAIAAWHYLTTTGHYAPSQILLVGDSAGGHLALALISQLMAEGMPLPGGLALCSPWADFTFSFPSWKSKAGTDYLSRTLLGKAVQSAVRYYMRPALRMPLFSPALALEGHWKGLVGTPVFVSIGEDEVFADEDFALVQGMRRDGVEVTVFVEENGLHAGPSANSTPGVYERFAEGVQDILGAMHSKKA